MGYLEDISMVDVLREINYQTLGGDLVDDVIEQVQNKDQQKDLPFYRVHPRFWQTSYNPHTAIRTRHFMNLRRTIYIFHKYCQIDEDKEVDWGNDVDRNKKTLGPV